MVKSGARLDPKARLLVYLGTEEVIKILGEFLRKPNMFTNSGRDVVPTWDRERDDNAFSWLGWTVVNGTAEDVAALISSRQPFDPLLGITDPLEKIFCSEIYI